MLPPKIAEKDACLMERVVSAVTMEWLAEFLESRVETDNPGESLRQENDTREGEHMTSTKARALSALSPEMSGRVIRVASQGELRRRILDMGAVPGAEVRVDGVAPLGDPLEITVRSYHLSLRKSEAKDIYVEAE